MHRKIEIVVPAQITPLIKLELLNNPKVLGFTLLTGASEKPKGDVLQLHLLNSGADEVLALISKHCGNKNFSVVTSEVASISDPDHQKAINHDSDDAIWEEVETGLRHTGKLSSNFLLLMAIGGIIAAIGFVADIQMQIIAFISASIIAPGFEPIAKIPLGIVLHNKDVFWEGVKSSLVGHALLVLAAGLVFYVLLKTGSVREEQFLNDNFAISLTHLTLKDLIHSLVACAAGIIMYLSYRRNVIAGPLIALITIPTAAALGICLVLSQWGFALQVLYRLGLDFAFIILVGVVCIWLKQIRVSKRTPLR